MQDKVDFGFRKVEPQEKAPLVRGVFDSVASRYDLMNDLMSGGLHRLWKNSMIDWLAPRDGMSVIDVAGGTGDIAMRILQAMEQNACPPLEGGQDFRQKIQGGYKKSSATPPESAGADSAPPQGGGITVVDINHAMLEQGRNRAIDHNCLNDIEWVCANAEALPCPDNHFDAYTIAFGIRNVTYIDKALAEAYRVLKPGGRFLCLEFSTIPQAWMRKLYDLYSFNVIPQVGKMVTGDADSYQYLVESIRKFPNQERLAEMMREAGFGNVQYRNMTQGVVALHSGRKL